MSGSTCSACQNSIDETEYCQWLNDASNWPLKQELFLERSLCPKCFDGVYDKFVKAIEAEIISDGPDYRDLCENCQVSFNDGCDHFNECRDEDGLR